MTKQSTFYALWDVTVYEAHSLQILRRDMHSTCFDCETPCPKLMRCYKVPLLQGCQKEQQLLALVRLRLSEWRHARGIETPVHGECLPATGLAGRAAAAGADADAAWGGGRLSGRVLLGFW